MTNQPKTIYLNQDDAAFYRCKPVSEMTIEGLQRTVDFYAQGEQLAGLAFCVNMQRALFDSQVWETMIDGFDPDLGDDQPVIARGGESRGLAELRRKGIDQYEVWIERARSHGIEAFLSMRMNDCHGLEGHGDWWATRTKGADQAHFAFHASQMWKDHPEWRRASHRYERSFESGYDFAHPEVRVHHLKLIAEVFERYDMDGFELDWMRWLYFFAPGGEARGRAILSDFVAQVHAIRRSAEIRWNHAIALRHRVPAEPESAYAIGFDVALWADMGAVQQLILSSFGGCANFDIPIPLWRRLVGPKVKLLALVEPVASPFPGEQTMDYHLLYGAASAALERGADGVYLFNECYRETGTDAERELLKNALNDIGDPDSLKRVARRYAVTFPQIPGPGRSAGTVLPIPLTNAHVGASFARMADAIPLRLSIGRKDDLSDFTLRLGFSSEAPIEELATMPVWVNSKRVSSGDAPVYLDITAEAFPNGAGVKVPDAVAHLLHYDIPTEALLDDVNIVEFEPPAVAGSLVWAEIIAVPQGGG